MTLNVTTVPQISKRQKGKKKKEISEISIVISYHLSKHFSESVFLNTGV